jgi:hypothetical protein
METNGSGTEYNTMSRLGEVDPDECDALADVFLGVAPGRRSDEDLDADEPAPRPRVLQLVIGSHLADADALFARLCRSESVDPDRAVGCIHHVGPGWSARLIGCGHRFNGRRATVAHAMNQVSAAADRVNILLPPHREVGQLIDGLDGLADPPDSVVVLATADESEVVAAYRQIKSIAAFGRAQLERTRVVLVDEPGPEAEAALRRLTDTATRFLDAPIPGVVLPRDEQPEPLEPPAVDASGADPLDAEPSEPADKPEPEPDARAATDGDAAPEDESLLATIAPGLTVLKFRCPEAPGVVLAVDEAGLVHAIAATGPLGDLDGQPDPLTALTRARAFVARHMPVLEPLDPRIRSAAGAPVAHLVSDRFGALEPCLRTDLRLHLVVPVRAGGRTVWGVRELVAD